jgi:threonine/homoserine/homoserine lactone efflux protein
VPDPGRLALYVPAALLLLALPGPAVMYVVTQSVSHGRRAGLVSVLGIETGALVHVAAATIGLSSLLASSATAFETVRYAGAAYLVVLGLRRLLGRDEAAEAPRASGRSLYTRGAVVNVLNPKLALFFLAFLPQFVDTSRAAAPQILVLGLTWIGLATLSDGAYALAAGTLGERLRTSRRFRVGERYGAGAVFVGLGVTAALTGSRR